MLFWRALIAGFLLCLGLSLAAPANAESSFANWAAIVVAGDWHAHSGGPSEVFDNGRRDLAKAFTAIGISPANLREFSVRPSHYQTEPLSKSSPNIIYQQLSDLTRQARGGCLIYFTSHGAPNGVIVDDRIWPPAMMAQMIDATCGERPTVVVISACFSGVFVPALEGPNRMIMTAARRDRTSFGCGDDDRYTYFDGCVLQVLPHAHDFEALAGGVRACVTQREAETGATPPSQPQLAIGPVLHPMLPLYAFASSP